MKDSNIRIDEILEKCQDTVCIMRKKKRVGHLFRNIELSVRLVLRLQIHLTVTSTDIILVSDN